MKIYMVRHGQTDANAAKIIASQGIDQSLNEEGRRQAIELAKDINKMQFDVIFSSPLKRAAETARIIAQGQAIPVVLCDELKERNFGSLSGKTYEDAAHTAGQAPKTFKDADRAQKYDYRPFGGESAKEVRQRLLRFTAMIKSEYANKQVLIVAHAGIVRLAHLLFREVRVDKIRNASIEEFEV